MSDIDTIARGKHLHLVKRGTWEFARRPNVCGIVGIVAVTEARELILVEQFRPPVNATVIELPAGLAGDLADAPTEDLAIAAQRELLEETGYAASEMVKLAEGPASAGLSDEVITLFLARGLTRQADGGGDDSESIVVHHVSLATIDEWLGEQTKGGKMVDLKVYAGLRFVE
jgi:ADP-ribose pyrophosphatase